MPDPTRERKIELALQAINNYGFSVNQAAKEFDIVPVTLYRRYHGISSPPIGRRKKQALSSDQEDELADWILEQQAKGTALSRNWVERFRARNPKVAKKSVFDDVEEQEARHVVTEKSDYAKIRSNYGLFLEQRARLLAGQPEEETKQASEGL
ncbi:hypothetical protein EDC01DRAFT_776339 [Geopyxis carbonaria]|nr:hypothetical protein EDC01DRAFT_776339 [Geopyxis carbonaria]